MVNVVIESNIDIDIENVFSGCVNLKGEEYGNAYYLGKYFRGLKNEDVTNVEIKNGCEIIPANAFAGSKVESVIIPASIKKIGANAFANSKLSEVVIPATVEEIENGAFNNCEQLQNVTINTNAFFEFNEVFENCQAINYTEYGNVYYVGNRFVKPVSTDITWAKIKNDCTYIPKDAFKNCTMLNKVYVPESVTRVGSHAFYNVNTHYFACCFERASISGITFDAGADESILSSTSQATDYKFNLMPRGVKLASNGIAYAYKDMIEITNEDAYKIVIYGYFGEAEEVTIEDKYLHDGNLVEVGLIFQHVFMDNTTVEKVIVKGCGMIGAEAFLNAKALEEVVLPSSGCVQIGVRAFAGCEELEEVTFGTGVILISKNAFENCNDLEVVKCATSLKAWDDNATLKQTFSANENMASAIKNGLVDCWLFDAIYAEENVRATIALLNPQQ